MCSAQFEMLSGADQREAHAAVGESMAPKLEHVPAFVDGLLYKSLVREGCSSLRRASETRSRSVVGGRIGVTTKGRQSAAERCWRTVDSCHYDTAWLERGLSRPAAQRGLE